jgi:ATP-dependent RNA helicase DDX55/SPB4
VILLRNLISENANFFKLHGKID